MSALACAVPARAQTVERVAMAVRQGQLSIDDLRSLALAGRQGDGHAAQLLGWLLATGTKVRVNLPLAVVWYAQSYLDGVTVSLRDARLVLDHMNERQRTELDPRLIRFIMVGIVHAPQSGPEAAAKDEVRAMVREEAARAHVAPALAEAVSYVESRFQWNALSDKGARGVMQIMPTTGEALRVDRDALWDPRTNIQTGVRYLSLLMRQYGRVDKALAHYVGGTSAGEAYPAVPEDVQRYVNDVLSKVPQFAAEDGGGSGLGGSGLGGSGLGGLGGIAQALGGQSLGGQGLGGIGEIGGAAAKPALRTPHRPKRGTVLIMRGSSTD